MSFSKKSISKQCDHPSDRVKITNDLSPVRKHRDRIEYSSKIGEWREKKSWNDGDLVKCLGKEGIDKPKSTKKISKKKESDENDSWMDNKISAKKQ